MFGGSGVDKRQNTGILNDLWKYPPSTGEWTWESGSQVFDSLNLTGFAGVYGTRGQPAATNVDAAVWTDINRNVWLFGGDGDSTTLGGGGGLNDLWWFQSSSSSGCSGFGCEQASGEFAALRKSSRPEFEDRFGSRLSLRRKSLTGHQRSSVRSCCISFWDIREA